MSKNLRMTLLVVLSFMALIFWYLAITVPMVSATAPALFAIFLSVLVYFIWRKKPKKVSRGEISA